MESKLVSMPVTRKTKETTRLLLSLLLVLCVTMVACEAAVQEQPTAERATSTPAEETEGPSLFPEGEAHSKGYLRVSEVHELYYELYGNPKGIPVVVLHGGPGGQASPYMRRFFDPERFKVLLFDQRGAGRSRPASRWWRGGGGGRWGSGATTTRSS